jgi:hypothetical protein
MDKRVEEMAALGTWQVYLADAWGFPDIPLIASRPADLG